MPPGKRDLLPPVIGSCSFTSALEQDGEITEPSKLLCLPWPTMPAQEAGDRVSQKTRWGGHDPPRIDDSCAED